jgi:hypothetical protein
MPIKVFEKPSPQKVAAILAAAGIPPGGKIPLALLDKVFAAQGLDIRSRLAAKAELAHLGVIEL